MNIAQPSWPDEKGRHATLPQQDFVTPSTSHKWVVDYPAGTVIQFDLSVSFLSEAPAKLQSLESSLTSALPPQPWWRGGMGATVYGASENMTVQAGSTTDCIPQDHFPIITTIPKTLTECEPAVFYWEGGENRGPFEAYALGKLTSGDWQWESIRNVGNESFGWMVDYPVGTQVEIGIFQQNGMTQTRIDLVVNEKGSSTSCIPTNHLPAKRRWYRRPAAITGFVIVGLIVAALVGYMGYRGFLTWKAKKDGGIRLEDEAETSA
ncbi:hypothetical protein P7C70_g189, partial [Phenoliferia sp. Uapishka_3]